MLSKRFSVSASFFLLAVVFVFDLFLIAQFTPGELAERAKWEEFLKTAEIIKSEDISEGITKPKRLLLRKGDAERHAIWKCPGGTDAGAFDKWQAEIAAYRMDKLLGLNMVPPTAERKYRGRSGSIQLWVELETSELERARESIPIPSDKVDHCQKMIDLERAFDSLIANIDRSLQNIRYTKDWRLILIDHSRSFRSSRIYTGQLIYGKNGIRKKMLFLTLPRAFVEKVRSLTYGDIRNAVGPYLTSEEIEAVLIRRKLLLKEVDEMIRESGEDKVLY